MKRLDAATIRHQIEALFVAFPELHDDDILRADTFEGETDLIEYLRYLEDKRSDALSKAQALKMRIDGLKERGDRYEHRCEGLRAAMFKAMEWAEQRKVELPEATLLIREGTQRVIIHDEAAVPDIYCRIRREPDKTKIKAALSEFGDVPGASLSNAEPVLTVRIK